MFGVIAVFRYDFGIAHVSYCLRLKPTLPERLLVNPVPLR